MDKRISFAPIWVILTGMMVISLSVTFFIRPLDITILIIYGLLGWVILFIQQAVRMYKENK
jgi:hypothetical protein